MLFFPLCHVLIPCLSTDVNLSFLCCSNIDGAGSGGSSQRSSPAVDKLGREVRENRDARDSHDQAGSVAAKDAVLDGASPPVQTIIFENTNYKQAPSASSKFPSHPKGGSRIDKPRGKMSPLGLFCFPSKPPL